MTKINICQATLRIFLKNNLTKTKCGIILTMFYTTISIFFILSLLRMAKTVEGVDSSKLKDLVSQAKFVGTVKRVGKIVEPPHRIEFTVAVRETNLNGELFTIGDKVTFTVDNNLSSGRVLVVLANLAPGDAVNVKVEKRDGKWQVVELLNLPDRGRSVDDFLNDLEEEQKAHNKR